MSESNESSFKLSRTNLVLLFLLITFHVLGYVLSPTKSAYALGVMVGGVTVALLIPSVLALLTWRLSGRKPRAGNLVFGVLAMLMLVSAIGQRVKPPHARDQVLQEMEAQTVDAKRAIAAAETPEDVDASVQEFVGAVNASMQKMIAETSGDERQMYIRLNAHMQESQAEMLKWREALAAFQDPKVFNFSVLAVEDDWERQRGVLSAYFDASEAFHAYFLEVPDRLKKRMEGLPEKVTKGAVSGAIESHERQKPHFVPLMNAHKTYAKRMLGVMDFMQEATGGWETSESGKILFTQDGLLAEFDVLMGKIAEDEATIGQLEAALQQVL